jgi:hypothetical protein
MSSPASLVAPLHGAIEQLLAADTTALTPDELHELLVSVRAEQSRLSVAAADVVHAWERSGRWQADGSLSASLAMARDTKGCHRQSRTELHRARLLRRMPHTRAAVLAGRLSMDHVELFVRHATAARFELFLEHERMLVEQCAAFQLFDDARRLLQYWANRTDDELGLRPAAPAPSTLYSSREADHGQLHLDGRFSAIDSEIVHRELSRLLREVELEDRAKGITRTKAQRRAIALVRMASRSVNATGVTARPLFQVIVGDETARRLCELASGIVMRPDDLVPVIDAAVMEAFLFDGPSVVIAKTHRRTFTGALRRAIQVRDRRCQHTSGCTTPAADCDIDHRKPAAWGGPTSQFNGRAGCVPHNRLGHLRDEVEPMPERAVDTLDAIRCRLRWHELNADS